MAFNAREMKKLADKHEVSKSDKSVVERGVKESAKGGETSTTFACSLFENTDNIQKHLKQNGFRVKYVSDQRDGDYLEVSWS